MKLYGARLRGLVLAGTLTVLAGCDGTSENPVAQGVIFSVEYQTEAGHTEGFTRANNAQAVPGGNGSWNVDATGKLTRDFLIITRPTGFGPQVIPVQRLIYVQFGDGGIKNVNQNQPAPK